MMGAAARERIVGQDHAHDQVIINRVIGQKSIAVAPGVMEGVPGEGVYKTGGGKGPGGAVSGLVRLTGAAPEM